MKALLVSAAAVGLLSAAPAFAQAGNPDSAQGSAAAEIVAPITVDADTNGGILNFGRLVGGSAAYTVTVIGDGTRSGSDTNMLLSGGTAPSAAGFNVTGQSGLVYTVTLPVGGVTLTGPGTAMTSTLVAYDNGDGEYKINAGVDSFTVGGTLSVGAAQTPGNYSGNFNVVVQYN